MGNAFCRGGFSYSGGRLLVPRAGLYRVFLQVTYASNCSSGKTMLTNTVLHFRASYPADVPLLTSADVVDCSVERWTKSLYAAGLFFLEAGSQLRVTSSRPRLVVHREQQTFFGAELLLQ